MRTFIYNEKDEIIAETGVTTFQLAKSMDSTSYLHNVHDQTTEARYYIDGVLESRRTYKYNEKYLVAGVISYTGKKKNHKSIQRSETMR